MCPRLFLFFLLAIVGPAAYAQRAILVVPPSHVIDPVRHISELYEHVPEEDMLEVETAHVVIADYGLIKRDFRYLIGRSKDEINHWILENGGRWISRSQASQALVNSPIRLTGRVRKAYRPQGYGRGAIYVVHEVIDGVEHWGLIDSNGDGVGPGLTPSFASHRNGLGTEAEKLRDFFFENAFRASLIHAHSPYGTLGSYAVIGLGFDVRYGDGGTRPAGKYMRQVGKRLNYNMGMRAAWLPGDLKDGILKHISRYGFYTGWETNIQGTVKDGKIFVFDFGHWIAWQGNVPESGITVDPSVSIDFNLWGWDPKDGPMRQRGKDQWRTSQLDRPFLWAADTAIADLRGEGVEAAANFYNTMVGPFLQKLGVGLNPDHVFPVHGGSCGGEFNY